jgi:hypothetical protein
MKNRVNKETAEQISLFVPLKLCAHWLKEVRATENGLGVESLM